MTHKVSYSDFQVSYSNFLVFLEPQFKKSSIYNFEKRMQLATILADKVNELEVLDKFYKRHAWLITTRQKLNSDEREEILRLTSFIGDFSRHFLSDFINHKDDSLDIDNNELSNFIEIYCLSMIKRNHFGDVKHYISRLTDLLNDRDNDWPSLSKIEYSDKNFNLSKYSFSRLDIYNFLDESYPQLIRPDSTLMVYERNKHGHMTRDPNFFKKGFVKILVVSKEELPYVSQDQLNYAETILVNTSGNEAHPDWALIQKTKNKWILYGQTYQHTHLEKEMEKLQKVLFQEVGNGQTDRLEQFKRSYEFQNITEFQRDESGIDPNVTLFQIILPYYHTQSSPEGELKQFRANIPSDLLRWDMLVKSIYDRKDFPLKKNILLNQFFYGFPLSNSKNFWIGETLQPDDRLLEEPFSTINLSLSTLIKCFEDGNLTLSGKKLTIEKESTDTILLLNALFLTYRYRVTQLTIPNLSHPLTPLETNMFDYHVNLEEISGKKTAALQFPLQCVARNNFLRLVKNRSFFKEITDNTHLRKQLWPLTGQAMVDYFNQDGRKNEENILKTMRELESQGLDCLFNYLDTHYGKQIDNFAPNLNAKFNVEKSAYESTSDYLAYLTQKIEKFSDDFPHCSPLFNSLELILPTQITPDIQKSLTALLIVLDKRTDKHPQENCAFILRNVDKENGTLIKHLNDAVTNNRLRITIKLNEWDKDIYLNPTKGNYLELQNNIAHNQRSFNQSLQTNNPLFNENSHYQAHTAILSDVPEWSKQPYLLSAEKVGIQQQFQQAQEQQQEQQQEHQREQQEEKQEAYLGDEDTLIDRTNIDQRFQNAKQRLTTKLEDKDLREYFSDWVGSKKNAPQIIEYMEAAAVEKIIDYAEIFRFGLNKENLPAGFYLAIGNKGLILCFDTEREKQALKIENELPINKRDPFKIILHPQKPITPFLGDFRQFADSFGITADSTSSLQGLWQLLAYQPDEPKKVTQAENLLNDNTIDRRDALVVIQAMNANRDKVTPENETAILQKLKAWATQLSLPDTLITNLFDAPNTVNTLALGQLFNQLGKEGIDKWLQLCKTIHHTFGPTNFKIWQEQCLNSSTNWSEFFEKETSEAIHQSLTKLNHNTQDLWWSIVESHGNSVGKVSYNSLWQSFNHVLNLVTHNQLHLDNLPKNLSPFNGQVFLERLYYVLKNAENHPYRKSIQQDILNNIESLDWHYNGFYYANRFQKYHSANPDLELSDFKETQNENNYAVSWPSGLEFADEVITKSHALRFADSQGKMGPDKINAIGDSELFKFFCDKPNMLRLYMACLTIGVDYSPTIEIPNYNYLNFSTDLLKEINEAIPFYSPLKTDVFHMDFSTLALFIDFLNKELDEVNLFRDNFRQLTPKERLEVLNALGRILRCEKKNPPINTSTIFNLYLQKINPTLKSPLELPVDVEYFPWLKEETGITREQINKSSALLRAVNKIKNVDIELSKGFPNAEDLRNLAHSIKSFDNTLNANKMVDTTFAAWAREKNCFVPNVAFNPITRVQRAELLNQLKAQLGVNFSQQNLSLIETLLDFVALPGIYPDFYLANFVKILTQIDNKAYFNELGPILTSLIKHSRAKGKQAYYSLPVLLEVFGIFTKDGVSKTSHFPGEIFNKVLSTHQTYYQDNLLSDELTKLSLSTDPQLERWVTALLDSPLPNSFKGNLISEIAKDDDFNDVLLEKLSTIYTPLVSLKSLTQFQNLLLTLKEDFQNPESDDVYDNADSIINELSKTNPLSKEMNAIWQHSQSKLIKLFLNGTLDKESLLRILTSTQHKETATIRIILSQAFSNKETINTELLENTLAVLTKLPLEKINELATYYLTKPRPTLNELNALLALKQEQYPTTSHLIHHYEATLNAADKNGLSKRNLTIDNEQLLRVLTGIKNKGGHSLSDKEQTQLLTSFSYCNDFAQTKHLETSTLKELLRLLEEVRKGNDNKEFQSAQMLAIIREVMLRQTGKWANHTQMLALFYGALHTDNSMILQLKTGEGKSIITAMQSAFLALQGCTVDIFSAKQSLAHRDYQYAFGLLKALGIPQGYITSNSPSNEYKQAKGAMGAVNYSTLGEWSLFYSRIKWEGIPFELGSEKRICILDEGDHILLDEDTQFNFSASIGGQTTYNYDAWIYEIAYDFYLDTDFRKSDDPNICEITSKHLSDLFARLNHKKSESPVQSQFFTNYVTPALSGNPLAIKLLEQRLVKLIKAANNAKKLKENEDFCIKSETKQINNEQITVRAAKVMIDNQIIEGATYSDLVQQLLHVRLNKNAQRENTPADFFIDPENQIALSSNVAYIVENYYNIILGYTGTAGSALDLEKLIELGIQHIIKLPTHAPRRTEVLAPEFVDDEDVQVNLLAQQIIDNRTQPILITCENDKAVSHLSVAIQKRICELDLNFDLKQLITDTNAQGIPEATITKKAGINGMITISSRLGRGTDISPENKELGLRVLRTYPAHARITKQEMGRQGRNGEIGTVLEIINRSNFETYLEHPLYEKEYNAQLQRIKQKKGKHPTQATWKKCAQDDNYSKSYAQARAVAQINYQVKKENAAAKLIHTVTTVLSKPVSDFIATLPSGEKNRFESEWLTCRTQIELSWQEFKDKAFLTRANELWQDFINSYPKIPSTPLENLIKPHKITLNVDKVKPELHLDELECLTHFYKQYLATKCIIPFPEQKDLLAFNAGFENFYQAMSKVKNNSALFPFIQDLVIKEEAFTLSRQALAEIILMSHDKNLQEPLKWLTEYLGSEPFSLMPTDVDKRSLIILTVFKIISVNPDIPINEKSEFINKLGSIINHPDYSIKKNADEIVELFSAPLYLSKALDTQAISQLIHSLRKERLPSWKNYLNNHLDYLDARKALLYPLAKLHLLQDNYLPDINFLEANPAQEEAFWLFLSELSEKQPLSQENLSSLMHALKNENNSAHINTLIPQLTQLSRLGLTYINQLAASENFVQIMDETSQAFKQFTNFIEHTNLDYWPMLDQFKTMTPAQNTLFFSSVLPRNINNASLIHLINYFKETSLNANELKALITSLPIEKVNTEQADNLPAIYSAFHQTLSIDPGERPALLKKAEAIIQNPGKIDEFNTAIKNAKKIGHDPVILKIEEQFGEHSEKGKFLLDLYSKAEKNDPIKVNFVVFCDKLQAYPNFTFDKFKELANHCLNQTDTEVTKATIEVFGLLDYENDREQKLTHLFNAENPWEAEKQKNRQTLMQHVYKNLIQDETLTNTCQDNYHLFAQKLISVPERRNNIDKFKTCFQNVIKFCNELITVQIPSLPMNKPDIAGAKNRHFQFFKKITDDYTKKWLSTSSMRRYQANKLLSDLENQKLPQGKDYQVPEGANYYETTLNIIAAHQRKILITDSTINKSYHKKGYSKLYDITANMYLTVAKDCLNDFSIPHTEKTFLQDQLNKQLSLQLDILDKRLSNDHGLKKSIGDAIKHKTPENLKQIIDYKGKLDKRLLYLIENISELSGLIEPVAEPNKGQTL